MSARVNAEERDKRERKVRRRKKKKGIEAQRARSPTQTQAIDALKWDEEQNEKREERNREWVPNLATLDPSVASYDPQEPHGEVSLFF